MKYFLAYDSKFLRLMDKITDLVLLNILWTVCCIPVITIGAATNALIGTVMDIHISYDGKIYRQFWRRFIRENLVATCIWLQQLTGILLVAAGYLILQNINGIYSVLWISFYMMAIVVVSGMAVWNYPLLWLGERRILYNMKRALFIAACFMPWTVMIIVGNMLVFYIVTRNLLFIISWFIFGMAFYQYILGIVYLHIMKKFHLYQEE